MNCVCFSRHFWSVPHLRYAQASFFVATCHAHSFAAGELQVYFAWKTASNEERQWPGGSFHVTIISAADLMAADANGKSDPYVICRQG